MKQALTHPSIRLTIVPTRAYLSLKISYTISLPHLNTRGKMAEQYHSFFLIKYLTLSLESLTFKIFLLKQFYLVTLPINTYFNVVTTSYCEIIHGNKLQQLNLIKKFTCQFVLYWSLVRKLSGSNLWRPCKNSSSINDKNFPPWTTPKICLWGSVKHCVPSMSLLTLMETPL